VNCDVTIRDTDGVPNGALQESDSLETTVELRSIPSIFDN